MRKVTFLIVVFLIITGITPVTAGNDLSYTYNFWQEPVPGPPVFEIENKHTGQTLGVQNLRDPEEIFVDHNEHIYIADSGNNRIIHLDENWQKIRIIDYFINHQDEKEVFNNPTDVFVTPDNDIYIADRRNRRVVVVDEQLNIIQYITSPRTDRDHVFDEDFVFAPNKIAVSHFDNRVYVIADGVLEGLMVFDGQGVFEGFIGAPSVAPSVADYFWRTFMTEEQLQRTRRFIPTQYSNLDIGEEGFIYTTVSRGQIREEEAVRKLSPVGRDVLSRDGFVNPIGDVHYPDSGADASIAGPSLLYDITVHNSNIYSVLDNRRGRIFTYNSHGDLLFVFGGLGDQKQKFRNPVSLANKGDNLLILDRRKNAVIEFRPTDYALMIFAAINFYAEGYNYQATELWQHLSRLNPNLDLAYKNIGLAFLREDEFAGSMEMFRTGQYRTGYSRAFREYRRIMVKDNFGRVMITFFIALIIVIILIKFLFIADEEKITGIFYKDNNQKSRLRIFAERLRYAFYLIFHPFSSFWDLKEEKIGSVPSAVVLLLLATFSYLLLQAYSGFLFNYTDISQLNIYVELLSIIIPVILWCAVNWGLTTLMEGKGTMRDIFVSISYSLTPLMVCYLPLIPISHFLTLQEEPFYRLLLVIPVIWSLALVFFGTMITHNYTLSKNLLTVVSTIIGIGIVIFIGLLFFSVLGHLGGFVETIFTEITLRT